MHFCTFEGCFANYDKLCKLKEHELKHTGERPFVCNIDGCGKSYCRPAHLSRHIKSHSGQKDFVCLEDRCGQRFVSADNLKKHLKRFHQQSHKCEFEGCGEIFRKRQQLKAHQVTHTGIKPYRCEVEGCGMQFPLPSKLKRHMQKHEGRKCPKDGCDEIFNLWSLLRKHISTAHCEEKTCEDCGKKFMKKHKLRLHQRVHKEKINVFLCPRDGCDRTYTRMSYLQLHIDNYHEGARPFACTHESCTKTFAHKVSLEKHQVVHKPEYVKPQPKPRKSRSMASKISGIVKYVDKPKTKTKVPSTDVGNGNRVKKPQEVPLNSDSAEDNDNMNVEVTEVPYFESNVETQPEEVESNSEDIQLKQLPNENLNDTIDNEMNDCKKMHDNVSNSLAMNILESIQCQ